MRRISNGTVNGAQNRYHWGVNRTNDMANRRRLSAEFKAQLDSVGASLDRCSEILGRRSEEEETEERLKDWGRWVD